MSLTITDIADRLKRLDEITLLEVLGINSDMIVERFADIIEDKADELEEDLSDE